MQQTTSQSPNRSATSQQPRSKFAKLSEALDFTKKSRSATYRDINNETMPPPISLGGRGVFFIWSELEKWSEMIIQGKSTAEIQAWVRSLKEARKQSTS